MEEEEGHPHIWAASVFLLDFPFEGKLKSIVLSLFYTDRHGQKSTSGAPPCIPPLQTNCVGAQGGGGAPL